MKIHIENKNKTDFNNDITNDFYTYVMDIACESELYHLYQADHFFNKDFLELFGFLKYEVCMQNFQRMIDAMEIPVRRVELYKTTFYYINWEYAI